MKIEYLKWDSEFWGFKTGKLEIYSENEFDADIIRDKALRENYTLIYIIKYDKVLYNNAINLKNFELADIMITMSLPFNTAIVTNVDYDFREKLSNKEIEECYKIAEQVATVSRFYKEAIVDPESTKKLYRTWIDNSLKKEFSDGIFIEKQNNVICGIHLVRTDVANRIGIFTLTGVNSEIKRSGVGTRLWQQSFNYWRDNYNIDKIISPFSFQNKESLNFHLKMGFNKIEEIKYIYHYKS